MINISSFVFYFFGGGFLEYIKFFINAAGVLYWHATGFSYVLIIAIFVGLGKLVAGTHLFDSSFTLFLARFVIGIGVVLGTIAGWFFILPLALYGFMTLPITLPITIWKTFDQCYGSSDIPSWLLCALAYAPASNLHIIAKYVILPLTW